MKKYARFFRFFAGSFLALVVSGCALTPILLSGGISGVQSMLAESGANAKKTFREAELQPVIPALISFKQTTVLAPDGIYDWTGIWIPKNIDAVKGGEYTVLVLLNGNATRQDFLAGRDGVLSLYPGIKIVRTEELSSTSFYPIEPLSRLAIRYRLGGRSVQGDVYVVTIPPQIPKVAEPVKKKPSKKRKHR